MAGCVTAYRLTASRRVLLLEANRTGAGASGAAAGLAHRFLGGSPRLVWRSGAALNGLRGLLREVDASELFEERGVFRPARSEEEAIALRSLSERHPDLTEWLGVEALAERFSFGEAPYGGLFEPAGGTVRIDPMLERLAAVVDQSPGCTYRPGVRVESVNTAPDRPELLLTGGGRIAAPLVVLAVGAGYRDLTLLEDRGFESVKGQTLVTDRPREARNWPSLVGRGYAALFADRIVLGSTYERGYEHEAPTTAGERTIRTKCRELHPSFRTIEVRNHRADLRVLAPGHRKASIGPLPERSDVWMVGGFGSKGLLMAGLLAARLDRWIDDPDTIPHRLGVPG